MPLHYCLQFLISALKYDKDGITERPVVNKFTEDNCMPVFWHLLRYLKDDASLLSQLAHLVTVDNVVYLLKAEIQRREEERLVMKRSAAIDNRIKKLKSFIEVAVGRHFLAPERVGACRFRGKQCALGRHEEGAKSGAAGSSECKVRGAHPAGVPEGKRLAQLF